MKQSIYEILENVEIAKNTMKMVLAGDTSDCTAPGQFVNIKLDGFFLRRPISVCDYNEETITIIYKVVGGGTEAMAEMTPGQELDVLIGLGNGYDITKVGDAPVLIGGGVGVPPMYGLAKSIRQANPEEFASMGKATPFAGMKAYGKCLFNVAGGKTVWNAL